MSDNPNREMQQREIGVTGGARFVRQGGATPRARGRLSAAVGCTESTIQGSPAVTARGRRDYRNRGKPITLSVAGARVLSVDSDHPAIRGAVIAFMVERSCRRRAWLLVMGDCRTSIGDVGEQEPTSALRAGCLRPRGSELATTSPAARATQLVRYRDARPC
jgi:hypothetical protein